MKLPASASAALLVVTLIALAGGGFVAGAAAGRALSEPSQVSLVFSDPTQMDTTPEQAQRSGGGFTGFGGSPALAGDVLRSGVVGGVDDGSFTVDAAGASIVVSYSEPRRLFRIEPATTPLVEGDAVVVRLVDGAVTGVLRVLLPAP